MEDTPKTLFGFKEKKQKDERWKKTKDGKTTKDERCKMDENER